MKDIPYSTRPATADEAHKSQERFRLEDALRSKTDFRNEKNSHRELEEISTWPTEQEAIRMLKIVGASKTPGQTALLSILQWAVEDSGKPIGDAGVVLEELLYLASSSGHKTACKILLNLDGEECESNLPSLIGANTSDEIADAILSLANQVN